MTFIRVFFLLSWFVASSSFAQQITIQADLGKGATTDDWYQLAIWLEDKNGNYLDTLYVTKETAKEGLGNKYKTLFGVTIREEPGSLPVWAYSRKVFTDGSIYPSKAKPLADALTGATTKNQHWLKNFKIPTQIASQAYYCLIEINVSQDDTPSMVFRAKFPAKNKTNDFGFLGAGESAGANGKIYQLGKGFSPKNFIQSAQISG